MKKTFGLIIAICMLGFFSSCYTYGHRHPHGHLPPGKAKKIYGDKSAKHHAPGQRKKAKGPKHKRGRGHHKHDVYLFYLPGVVSPVSHH